jgi:hypothetical protein
MPTLVWAKGAQDNPCDELAEIADFERVLACIESLQTASQAQQQQIQTQQAEIQQLKSEQQAMKMRLSLADGLVAYYPFDGNANDLSGNGNHGVVNGAALTTDRFENASSAYQFDGNDDHILIGNSDSLNIDHRLTIGVWIKKEVNKSYSGLVGKDWSGYSFMFDKTGNKLKLELAHGSEKNYVSFSDSHTIGNNTWYHAVVVLSALNNNTNKVTFYVNGQKGSEKSTPYSDLADMPEMYIGYEGCCGDRYFKGIIDDVRIYNRALTEPEIQSLYKQR